MPGRLTLTQLPSMTDLVFINNCVSWPRRYVADLTAMCDTQLEVTRRTFMRHVDKWEFGLLEHKLGYSRHGLRMHQDYHVRYARGYLPGAGGAVVYFLIWSGIEYVFGPQTLEAYYGS